VRRRCASCGPGALGANAYLEQEKRVPAAVSAVFRGENSAQAEAKESTKQLELVDGSNVSDVLRRIAECSGVIAISESCVFWVWHGAVWRRQRLRVNCGLMCSL